MLDGRDLLLRHGHWLIGDGNNTRIYKDNWLDKETTLPNHPSLEANSTVSNLMLQNHRSWDVRKILNIFPRNIAVKIIATPILPEGEPDKLILPHTNNGRYEVKSGYHAEKAIKTNQEENCCSSSHTVDNLLWKNLWHAKVSPKIKKFIWKACQNAIPTRHNLHKRKLSDAPNCPICHAGTEDIEHMLLTCPWTRPIWFGSPLQWNPADHPITRFDLWLQEKLSQLSAQKDSYIQNSSLLFTLCWYIWKGRNLKIFEDHDPQPELTLSVAIKTSYDYLKEISNNECRDSKADFKTKPAPKSRWRPPPEGFIKANNDACFDDLGKICSIGVILRDDQGYMRSGTAKILPALSPLHAEALAMKEAHLLAHGLGLKELIYESDNQDLVHSCKKIATHWQISPIINEIDTVRLQFDTVAYSWCRREANCAADEIARLNKSFNLPRLWTAIPPPTLHQILTKDRDSSQLLL